jgi:hypothetical protein
MWIHDYAGHRCVHRSGELASYINFAILKPVDSLKRKYSCFLWLSDDITSTFISACVQDMDEIMWAILLSEMLWAGIEISPWLAGLFERHALVRCPREMTNETVTDSIDLRIAKDMRLIDASGLRGAICMRLWFGMNIDSNRRGRTFQGASAWTATGGLLYRPVHNSYHFLLHNTSNWCSIFGYFSALGDSSCNVVCLLSETSTQKT